LRLPSHFGTWIRGGLLVLGLVLVVYFVRTTGPRQVLGALAAAGRYVPLFAVLEVLAVYTDARAFGSLVGAERERISLRGWLRSSSVSYVCLTLLPAGRTASEVARASVLARYIGTVRAATAGAQLQAAALVADGIISAGAALIVVALVEPYRQLPLLLAGNVAIALGGGTTLLVLVHNPKVAQSLAGRFPRVFGKFATSEGRPYTWGLGACSWSLFGRLIQLLEHGIAVHAVGGSFALATAAVAYGIHVVSATIGVAVPNQVGIADGAYVLFADALGFAAAPARALAVMMSIRVTQVGLALLGLAMPFVLRRTGRGAVP